MSEREVGEQDKHLKTTFRGLKRDKNGKIMIKDNRVEIVKKETKMRYILSLEERMNQVQILKEEVRQLSGVLKDMVNNEIIIEEDNIEKEAKGISEMIVVDKEGEAFASE